jgi:hypothetical protein
LQHHGGVKKALMKGLFGALKAIPGVEGKVDEETAKMAKKLEDHILGDRSDETSVPTLPEEGWSRETIEAELTRGSRKV